MVLSSSLRPWLVPNVLLLVGLAVWGVLRYPHLPDRIPQHIGFDGVDAWTDRSVGSAFVLVFLHAGVTVLLTACAEAVLRTTPRDEPASGDAAPFAGRALSPFTPDRPRNRASARRAARALLVLDACIGLSLLVGCAVLWRSAPEPHVPGWLFAAMALPPLVGTALTVAAAVRDRKG
ncbi:DUF1648 domain-containing protein [Streptomyces sp. SP18CS02]|uniref:DUF1648 domain-containing protein n=1 Tax=Streptomyces sp. SP18CS02 TaxID=3002531 RepID=UPI002E78E5BA|nr:DUF1648 domain-containing protein [Streptomyces sp. SP18CS02]MEE1751390.1 DUF1648 domain-containing protein [Streptomyces sp. SP18CS02]